MDTSHHDHSYYSTSSCETESEEERVRPNFIQDESQSEEEEAVVGEKRCRSRSYQYIGSPETRRHRLSDDHEETSSVSSCHDSGVSVSDNECNANTTTGSDSAYNSNQTKWSDFSDKPIEEIIDECKDLSKTELVEFLRHTIGEIKKLQSQVKKLEHENDVPKEGELSRHQKQVLQKLIENRKNNLDPDGCIIIPCIGRGKNARYLNVPKTQTSSSDVSKVTQNRRSRFIETVYNILANKDDGSEESNVHALMVNTIKRNISSYVQAGDEAGLKVVSEFRRETILALKAVMTLKMWRMLKRTFKTEIGRDTFGSEGRLKNEIRDMEFTYECGTATSPCGDTINFVRVKDVLEVIKRMVTQLQETNRLVCLSNLPPETLWLHVSGDKGGKSTKLILQVINSKDRHSIQYTKLLGLFEGKDSRYNIEQVFSPIFNALHAASLEIDKLNLQRPCDDLLRDPCQLSCTTCSSEEGMFSGFYYCLLY